MTKTETIILENFDGSRAYYNNIKYLIFEYKGVKYALPDPTEEEEILTSITDRDSLGKLMPYLKIIDESGYEQARALNINHKRDEINSILEELSKDFI